MLRVRLVTGAHRSAFAVALGAIGILTMVATTVGGCDSAPVSHGSGGQSGSGAGGRAGGGGAPGPGGGGGLGGDGGGLAGAGGGGGAGGSAPAIVWSSDATKAVVEDTGGGFVGPPPAGSECGYGVGSYTFTVADDKLVWHFCDTAQTPFKYVDGSRVLNAGERAMLVDALDSVVISTKNLCGADKSTRLLTVTRPSGSVIYRDSFYSCLNQGMYVDGIDSVFSVASSFAK